MPDFDTYAALHFQHHLNLCTSSEKGLWHSDLLLELIGALCQCSDGNYRTQSRQVQKAHLLAHHMTGRDAITCVAAITEHCCTVRDITLPNGETWDIIAREVDHGRSTMQIVFEVSNEGATEYWALRGLDYGEATRRVWAEVSLEPVHPVPRVTYLWKDGHG